MIAMWLLILFGVVCLIMLALAWNAASPSKPDQGNSTPGYSRDDSAPRRIHSNPSRPGHDERNNGSRSD